MKLEKYDGLVIREAVPSDKGSESDIEGFSGNYLIPRALFLVILNAGDIIATIGLVPIDRTQAKLRKMYVKPEFRASGLGTVLVQQIIEKATTFGYKKIILETMTAMQSAIRLYRRFGFCQIDRSAVSKRCDIVMEKTLPN